MERFYLGFPDPNWLANPPALPEGVGAYVSHYRITRRPRASAYPRAALPWGCDSGTFSAADYGRELPTPEQYVRDVWRFDREISNLEWAACQARMCEPWMLDKMGWTTEGNQRHAIDNFKRLTDLWWELEDEDTSEAFGWAYTTPPERRAPDLCPFMPELQGWEPDDYRRHVEMYYAAGIELENYPLVGLGSVCRRATLKPIQDLVVELSAFLDLHGFGLKIDGVAALGPLLGSADSQAWSDGARKRLGACRHGRVKLERNCPTYAAEWAAQVWESAGEHIDWTDRAAGVTIEPRKNPARSYRRQGGETLLDLLV